MSDEKKTEVDDNQTLIGEVKLIPVAQIQLNPDNVNVMSDVDFNDLVEKINTRGFDQPIKVYFNEEVKKYEVVKGNHRYEAAKFLNIKEIPCVVGEYKDRDNALADGMSDNITRGKIDPEMFTREYNKLKKKYGTDKVMSMMNLSTHKQLQSYVKEVRSTLPEEMKKDLDAVKGEIKTIDDLSKILNNLFSNYGKDLKYSFMVFVHEGHDHIYVQANKELIGRVKNLAAECRSKQVDMNTYLLKLFGDKYTDVKQG